MICLPTYSLLVNSLIVVTVTKLQVTTSNCDNMVDIIDFKIENDIAPLVKICIYCKSY